MNRKIFPSLILLFVISASSLAQENDFGVWYTVNTDFGISKKLNAGITAEVRTFRNAGKIEEALLEAGAEYKLTSFLSAGASYRFAEALEDDSRYHPEHKLFLETKADVKPGRFTIQARIKYQIRFRTYFEEVSDKIPDQKLRFRLKTTYRTPSFPVNPWVFAETFIPTYPETDKFIAVLRMGTGVEYKISKNHSLEISYVFRRDYIPKLYNINLLNVGYNLSF